MRALLVAMECGKGEIEANLAAHLEVIDRANRDRVELVVFPEMSLTGYVEPDRHPEHAIALNHPAVRELVHAARLNVAVSFGIGERVEAVGGGSPTFHITQVLAHGGVIDAVQRKRHLGEGEEAFTAVATDQTEVMQVGALTLGAVICAESTVDHTWEATAAAGAQVVCFSSAPGLYGTREVDDDWRKGFEWWESAGLADARRAAKRLGVWVAMATQAGTGTDEDFPGIAALIAPDGTVVDRLPDWRPGVLDVEVPLSIDIDPPRRSIRVLVVDDDGATLLCRFRSPDTGHTWWVPPGGGVEDGEDDLTCIRRELAEELGADHVRVDPGPRIGVRHGGTFRFREQWITQHERWYLARAERFDVAQDHVATLAAEGIERFRWWTAEELRSEGIDTAPRNLPDVLDRIAAGDIPGPDDPLPF